MGIQKKIETLKIQVDCFSAGNRTLEEMAQRVKTEWDMERDSTHVVTDSRRADWNRALHATRAFDTGLRLFLEKFSHRSESSHSIGEYVHDLQRNVTRSTGFSQLDGSTATRINDEVVKKRNSYCHSAGAFPTHGEADYLIDRILEYYLIVLGLEK